MSTFRKTFAYPAKNSIPTDYIQKINEIIIHGIATNIILFSHRLTIWQTLESFKAVA